jgi:hypothetical protein
MKRLATGMAIVFTMATMAAAQGPMGGRGRGPGRGFGPGMMGGLPDLRTVVTGAPFSATETSQMQHTLANGNQIQRESESKIYRDSQGRIRVEHTGVNRTMIMIFDPVAGFSYVLNPTTKTAAKMPVPPAPPSGQRLGRGARAGAQTQTQDLGTQTINGVPATGTRITTTIPAGAIGNQQPIQIVKETWTSTALKVPVQIKTDDPRFGTSTTELTNIVQAEPDASLFVVPSDYTVTERSRGANGMRGWRRPAQN